MRKEWTPRDDERLADMWARGVLAAEIGHYFGCSDVAVHRRVRRLDLPRRNHAKPRTRYLHVKMSDEEHETLWRVARLRRRTMVAVVREALIQNIGPQYRAALEPKTRRA